VRLFSACEYVRKLVPTLKLADAAQAKMIQAIVVPNLDAV
jgi:hypothetical protein